jgi:hypothetical protein
MASLLLLLLWVHSLLLLRRLLPRLLLLCRGLLQLWS